MLNRFNLDSEITGDGPTTWIPSNYFNETKFYAIHSIINDEECDYDFQANHKAQSLATELWFDHYETELEQWRSHASRACWKADPLSELAVSISPAAHSNTADEQPDGPSTPASSTSNSSGPPEEPDATTGWIHDLWQTIFKPQAERWHRWERPGVTLYTWYLDHQRHRECQRPRTLHFEDDWMQWTDAIRRTWADKINNQLPFELHIIHPEPPRVTGEFHQGQVIITQNAHHEVSTVLSAVFDRFDRPKALWRAAQTLPGLTDKSQILRIIPGHMNMRWQDIWVVRNHHIVGYAPFAIQHGASLEVYQTEAIDDTTEEPGIRTRTHLDEDDGDEITLMARQLGPPAQQPAQPPLASDDDGSGADDDPNLPVDAVRNSALLFKLEFPGRAVRLRWDDYEIHHRHAAHYLHLNRHELVALHQVAHPPADIADVQTALLAQQRNEIPPGSTAKYILLDIEFHEHPPEFEPDTDRSARLIVSEVTRHNLLSMLGLIPYCKHLEDTCLVWKNHEYIRSDTDAVLRLQHGDFLRIAVPPHPRCTEIRTRRAALIHHHGLGESDYPRIIQHPPEDMDIEQMPNPTGHIGHLPFDDAAILIQIKAYTPPGKYGSHQNPLVSGPAYRNDKIRVETSTHKCLLQSLMRFKDSKNNFVYESSLTR